jgi:hypothetical protein
LEFNAKNQVPMYSQLYYKSEHHLKQIMLVWSAMETTKPGEHNNHRKKYNSRMIAKSTFLQWTKTLLNSEFHYSLKFDSKRFKLFLEII